MESHPSCPKAPEPIKLGVFAYGEKGLTAGGFSRAPPNVLSDVLRQVPAPTARRLATDEWIKAQLQLWGITFNQSSSPAHLRSMLESAYRSGKLLRPSPSLTNLESGLSAQFLKRQAAYLKDKKEWDDANTTQMNSVPAEDLAQQKHLEAHQSYLRSHLAPLGPLKLDDLMGMYIVRCEDIKTDKRLTLDIQPKTAVNGVVGAVDFGLFKGTILLAFSREGVGRLREEMGVKDADAEQEHVGHEGHDDWDDCDKKLRGKRPSVFRFRDAIRPHQLYFQWAGRVLDGERLKKGPAVGSSHVGYLDFDSSKATAHGEIACPEIREEGYRFSIHKCADLPLASPWKLAYFGY